MGVRVAARLLASWAGVAVAPRRLCRRAAVAPVRQLVEMFAEVELVWMLRMMMQRRSARKRKR